MFSERLSSKSDAKLVIFIQSSKFSRLKFEINIKIGSFYANPLSTGKCKISDFSFF